MQLKHFFALFLITLTAMTSCSKGVSYSQVDNIGGGWEKDSVYTYTIDVDNTKELYELDIVLRNDNTYPDQNLWLKVEWKDPSDTHHTDTLNIFLADEFGRWRGRGIGSNYNNLILYKDSLTYDAAGTYEYRISHLMRHNTLNGLTQIGLQLMKK